MATYFLLKKDTIQKGNAMKTIVSAIILTALVACSQETGQSASTNNASNISTQIASESAIQPTNNPQQRLADAKTLQEMLQKHAQENKNRPKISKEDQKDNEKVRQAAIADMKFFHEQTAQLRQLPLTDAETIKVRNMLVESREASADVLDKVLAVTDPNERVIMMSQTAQKMNQSMILQEQALSRLAILLKQP